MDRMDCNSDMAVVRTTEELKSSDPVKRHELEVCDMCVRCKCTTALSELSWQSLKLLTYCFRVHHLVLYLHLFFMASDTLNSRHQSLPPRLPLRLEEHTVSRSRLPSVEPAIVNEESSSAKARSTSIQPESLTPRAVTPAPQLRSETRSESVEPTSSSQPTPPDTIDMETFQQILDLDEDGNREFSRGMAWAYFSQVSNTFDDMDKAFESKDLAQLSILGHFLKGSSAALGVSKVQASCEKIQHYGQLRDEEEDTDLTSEAALGKIEPLLETVKDEYAAAEKWMKKWYLENDPDGEN